MAGENIIGRDKTSKSDSDMAQIITMIIQEIQNDCKKYMLLVSTEKEDKMLEIG